MNKVQEVADPFIERKREGKGTAKELQDALTALFNERTSVRDSHLLTWMICLYMHQKLEDNSKWSPFSFVY